MRRSSPSIPQVIVIPCFSCNDETPSTTPSMSEQQQQQQPHSPAATVSESGPQFRRVSLQRRFSGRQRSPDDSSNPLIFTHDHKPTVATTTASSGSGCDEILSDDDDDSSSGVVDQEEATRMEDFLRHRCASSACLPRAPPRNQLDRHGCLELRGVPVSVLVQRLARFLLAHSIEHGFHFGADGGGGGGGGGWRGEERQVRLQCRTGRLLRFCVFLWRGGNGGDDDDGDDSDDCVIVEVQRRCGCSVELRCVRRALFAALQEEEDVSALNSSSSPLSPCHKMIPSRFCRKVFEKYRPLKTRSDLSVDTASCTTDEDNSSCTSESIDRCKCLLGSPCRQSKELALECLLHLIDPSSSSSLETSVDEEQSAAAAARMILTDESIQQLLLQLLRNRSNGELHTMALQVLAHTLRILQTTTSTEPEPTVDLAAVMEVPSDFWQTVLHCCHTHVSNVTGRNMSPRDAELSIDVLKAVLETAPQAAVRKEELLLDLAVCHSYGQRYFLALEQKSQVLMDQLQKCISNTSPI